MVVCFCQDLLQGFLLQDVTRIVINAYQQIRNSDATWSPKHFVILLFDKMHVFAAV
jgi:hypothetical protein